MPNPLQSRYLQLAGQKFFQITYWVNKRLGELQNRRCYSLEGGQVEKMLA